MANFFTARDHYPSPEAYAPHDIAAKPVREPGEVDREVRRAETSTEGLGKELAELEAALVRVLLPDGPEKDANGSAPRQVPGSPLAQSIGGIADENERNRAYLRAILRRLAL